MNATSNGPQLLAFVENALALSAAELSRAVRETPDVVLRRADEVADLLATTWRGTSLQDLEQDLPEGELWPVAPLSLGDPFEQAHRLYKGWMTGGGARRRTISDTVERTTTHTQALLLYAHGVCIPNPLHRYFESERGLEPRDLLVAVAEIARLGPLLAGGVLSVFDAVPEDDVDWLNHPEYGAAMHDIRAETELLLGATGLSHIEQTSIANVLIERVLWQLRQQATALLAVKPSAAMFFDDPIERALFERISAVGVQATTQSHESLRLHNLIDLRLPGIADIGLGDMVLIRDDDSFGTFRTDMRRALIDSRPSLDDGDVSAARLIVREHMISGADRLKASTARGRIGDLIAKDSLGWLLGAALAASVEGLSGALTMALGKLIVDLTETPRSTSALRAHYVALAKPGDSVETDVRLGDASAVASLAAATQRLRTSRLARIGETITSWRDTDEMSVPPDLLATVEAFSETSGREDLRLICWLCLGAVRNALSRDDQLLFEAWPASKGDAGLERLAVIGVAAAQRDLSASLTLFARPALHWLLLRATTAPDTGLLPDDVAELNTIALHWRRWSFAS